MKHFRKSILALLALTLFGGAGAWAQGPTNVTQITTSMIASWANVNSDVTLADMQALGFEVVDENTARAWTGAPQGEYAILIYGFDGTYFYYVIFEDNGHSSLSYTTYSKRGLYDGIVYSGTKYFITTAPAEIELTNVGGNQWSLGQTPDYDVELQVEYYPKHALKNIPAGWTVKVNGTEQAKPYQGDSLLISETDSVTLVPAGNPRRVKSVTLEEEVPPTITVTWNNDDITGEWGTTFTKDGVTITADMIDFHDKNFMGGGTFSTTLGNFTKIEVSCGYSGASGTGWSGDSTKKTWTGNASSVSFSGDFMGMGQGNIKFVFTIEPTN